jgi:hypothetical protein
VKFKENGRPINRSRTISLAKVMKKMQKLIPQNLMLQQQLKKGACGLAGLWQGY